MVRIAGKVSSISLVPVPHHDLQSPVPVSTAELTNGDGKLSPSKFTHTAILRDLKKQ